MCPEYKRIDFRFPQRLGIDPALALYPFATEKLLDVQREGTDRMRFNAGLHTPLALTHSVARRNLICGAKGSLEAICGGGVRLGLFQYLHALLCDLSDGLSFHGINFQIFFDFFKILFARNHPVTFIETQQKQMRLCEFCRVTLCEVPSDCPLLLLQNGSSFGI